MAESPKPPCLYRCDRCGVSMFWSDRMRHNCNPFHVELETLRSEVRSLKERVEALERGGNG